LAILQEAIESAGFIGDLVSNSDEISVIHKTIVQNVYNSDIVVCDISGKNPNVMFELGLRLAFDKATIIIKDEITPFSFDTSPIEHLIYPRDLNYHRMNDFKDKLKSKLIATHKKAQSDPKYSPFLKNFGEFTVAKLDNKEVTPDVFIVESLEELKAEMKATRRLVLDNIKTPSFERKTRDYIYRINLKSKSMIDIGDVQTISRAIYSELSINNYLSIDKLNANTYQLSISVKEAINIDQFSSIRDVIRALGYEIADE
jgi:hypothetical protein